jgi:predicted metal-binding transcription factor (methanogenesis marker protein 9)
VEIPTGEGRFRPLQTVATEFETQVRHLGLTKQTCTGSVALRYWCERNKNRCYIPEWLLEEWGIAVDTYISGAA